MGGKKKLGLKQMERMQGKKDDEDAKKKEKDKKAGPPKEKRTTINVIPPDAKNDKVVAEIKKMPVLTPYAVATRFNVRISAAKEFLNQLEQNGSVQLVSGSHNLKIYKPS
ncbi:MAG TPA: 30S ribosomal protein S25e [Candidatus Bathyarchaeia archaeon]|nr:30S ribosomal protein S25e [Candidatus Bathyarchaeia archaeon]